MAAHLCAHMTTCGDGLDRDPGEALGPKGSPRRLFQSPAQKSADSSCAKLVQGPQFQHSMVGENVTDI